MGCVSSIFCGFAFGVDGMRFYSLHLFVGFGCVCFVALGFGVFNSVGSCCLWVVRFGVAGCWYLVVVILLLSMLFGY